MSTLKAKQFHLIEDMDIAAFVFAAVERVEDVAAKVVEIYRLWVRRSNDRRLLAQMGDRLLQDVGLTRIDVDRETAKYFWQQ